MVNCRILQVAAILMSLAAGASGQPAKSPHYYPGQVGPEFRWFFNSLGDRLQVPGKERLNLGGSLLQPGRASAPIPVLVVLDISGALALNASGGPPLRVAFDGQQLGSSASGGVGKVDQDLVDSLLDDSMEHFLIGRIQGNAMRPITRAAKMKDSQNPTGPDLLCDAYSMAYRTSVSWKDPAQVKTYCFDAVTHLLSTVFYQVSANGSHSATAVETRFANWTSIEKQTQMVPYTIVRYENGAPTFTFTIETATLTPAAADGLFNVH